MKIERLEQIVEYQLCCGCGLCAHICPENIRMTDVLTFGRRPKFSGNISSDSLQLALTLCPGASLTRRQENLQHKEAIESLTRKWGPVLGIWEGHAADSDIRFSGSSGGAMSAIALYCLENEVAYGVLHTTADTKHPYINKTVMSKSREELLTASGSRYSPASPCEGLEKILNAPSPCVFMGKPCDVAAVFNARQHFADLNGKVALTIACFCAGTPSTNGTLEMLRYMSIDLPNNLVALRYRGCGWPGKTVAEIRTENGLVRQELTYEQSWGGILQKHRQWRCYICPDHTGEFADIAVGDPWYRKIEVGELGRSLIIARTDRGREIIERAISNGYLIAEKADPMILPASQPNLMKTRAMLWGRLLALKLNRAPCPSFNGFELLASWKSDLTLSEKVKTIFGTVKRIYLKKLKKKRKDT